MQTAQRESTDEIKELRESLVQNQNEIEQLKHSEVLKREEFNAVKLQMDDLSIQGMRV